MSANRTVTQRRSSGNAELGTRGLLGSEGAAVAAPSEAPHSMQTFCPAAKGVEQDGQRSSSRLPPSMQNLAPSGLPAPQLPHLFTPQLCRPPVWAWAISVPARAG